VVGDLLIKAGIPAERIHVSSKGATEPIVKRPANVAEPLNRRVEVFVR
jgi:flagellar motor protein MotB